MHARNQHLPLGALSVLWTLDLATSLLLFGFLGRREANPWLDEYSLSELAGAKMAVLGLVILLILTAARFTRDPLSRRILRTGVSASCAILYGVVSWNLLVMMQTLSLR